MAEAQERVAEIAQLTAEVAEKLGSGDTVSSTLATSERIIARVTDGIYREPWAAFRELIANAYDADATRVIVETGAPDFKQVIVRDNGNGMTPETVVYLVKSIGGSSKRKKVGEQYNTVSLENAELSPSGRPLIGKIGIGLFAVAQLTQHFQIITKAANTDVRTSATIKLRTHDEDRFGSASEEGYSAGEVAITTERVKHDDLSSHGTTVVLYSLRQEIRRSLQSYTRWAVSQELGSDSKAYRPPPIYHIGALPGYIPGLRGGLEENLPWTNDTEPGERFRRLVEAAGDASGRFRAPADLDHFDEYLKLIWKLSLALPLRYQGLHPFSFCGDSGLLFLSGPGRDYEGGPLELDGARTIRDVLDLTTVENASGLEFSVFLDGTELLRPIELPATLRRKSRVSAPMLLVGKIEEAFRKSELDRAGGQLSFEGYLYWNSQIIPKETAGVLIRVREASGTLFDSSFLDYRISEQNRLSQITAEIFVKQGLDGAINIDRESFNYSHPHFLFVQKWLHRALRLLINRNKSIAKQHLTKERRSQRAASRRSLIEAALHVWEKRKGEEADVPIPSEGSETLISDIGGVEIDWSSSGIDVEVSKLSATAIVLEAYEVLQNLDEEERAALIGDILRVLETK